MSLRGWTEQQAQGLVDSLKLDGTIPNWKPEYLQRLHDWCSAHEKDPTTVEGQLDFIAYELRNCFEVIGRELDRAETKQAAIDAIEPYVRLLCNEG
jgi:hypothetical protein